MQLQQDIEDKMKLFTELVEDVQLISEAKESGGKDYYIEGVFLQGNIKNRNGRWYPVEVLETEVKRYVKEVVDKNRAFGELGHPSGPSINLDRVSHIITELKRDGSNFIGKARISKTPMGEIARGIMESGGQLGVSSRAMGSLKEERGVMVVQNDLRLSTAADIVADPSAPDAFVNGIMEGVEWLYDPAKGTWLEQKLLDTKKAIHNMSKSKLEEQKMAILEDYIASLAVKN
jgi:hypothetical protein